MIGRERSLEKALEEVSDDYDFVCIDTPPSLGLLTVNALTAADRVIVPVQCEYLSMRGLVQLQNTLEMIKEQLNPGVEIEGILPTMLDARTVHAKEAVEILEENFGDLVFKTRIRKAIKFAEAPGPRSQRPQVRSQRRGGRVLPRPGEGGSHPWRVVSGPACARVRSPISSARPSSRRTRPRRRPPPTRRDEPETSVMRDEEPAAPPEPAPEPPAPEPPAPQAPQRPVPDQPAGTELDPERVHAYRPEESAAPVVPEPKERLSRIFTEEGPDPEGPAFGRSEPDASAPVGPPRPHSPVIRVVGVGGAGVNAVNRMVEAQIPGVEFMAINTDLQSLQQSTADVTVHLGSGVARGLGTGADPEMGYKAAFEEQDKVKRLLKGSDMVFVTAGAGGGTGTGAAPVVARLARDVGALTVGIVTRPFRFEGTRREQQAKEGIDALAAEVDTLIVVPNERLLTVLARNTTMVEAFQVADDVLRQGVQGISELITLPGLINLDFADVRTIMRDAGQALLGIGMGTGDSRANFAAEQAVSSPLLETSVEGARSILLSITGGPGPDPARGLRGGQDRPGGGSPRRQHHLRRQRRRGPRRPGLGDRDRHPLRRQRPPRGRARHLRAARRRHRPGRSPQAGGPARGHREELRVAPARPGTRRPRVPSVGSAAAPPRLPGDVARGRSRRPPAHRRGGREGAARGRQRRRRRGRGGADVVRHREPADRARRRRLHARPRAAARSRCCSTSSSSSRGAAAPARRSELVPIPVYFSPDTPQVFNVGAASCGVPGHPGRPRAGARALRVGADGRPRPARGGARARRASRSTPGRRSSSRS